jgi:iron complex transport system substrate-binding protein
MRRILLAIILLLTGISIPSMGASAPVRATDFRGKAITLAQPARRVVCLIESALSGLYMLGAGSQVVAVSANVYQEPMRMWYAGLDERIPRRQLPAPGNWDFVSLERVIALRPDLVIIWSHQTESIAALEERGIPVFGVFLASREDVYREIQALGVLTGHEMRANQLVSETRREVDRIASRMAKLKDEARPGVYQMWAQGLLDTSGSPSMVDDLIRLAGGRNVAASLHQEHAVVSLERVLGWNPDLILMWCNDRLSPGDIRANPQWKRIKAVQSGRIHELPEAFLCDLWTLKYPYALLLLAKWIHPQHFQDVDPATEEKRMLVRLYGKELHR